MQEIPRFDLECGILIIVYFSAMFRQNHNLPVVSWRRNLST